MISPFIAVIPARAGSKGLPGKNKRLLAGKPLILHTVDAAIQSGVFKRIIVSTDDDDIIKMLSGTGYHNVDIDIRPSNLATDTSEMADVIGYLIHTYDISNQDYISLLQPTSPLRDSKDIKKATELFVRSGMDALVSVNETDNSILKSCLVHDGVLTGINSDKFLFKNRQTLPKVYKPNGAIYIYRVLDLIENKGFHLRNTIPYIMDNEASLDIDDIEDFLKIEGKIT